MDNESFNRGYAVAEQRMHTKLSTWLEEHLGIGQHLAERMANEILNTSIPVEG